MTKFFLKLMILMTSLSASALEVNINDSEFSGNLMGTSTYWLRGDGTIADIQGKWSQGAFAKGKKDFLSFGFDDEPYWYQIQLSNNSNLEKTIWFHDSRNYSNSVQVYQEGELLKELLPHDSIFNRVVPISIPGNTSSNIFIRNDIYFPQQTTWTFWKDSQVLSKKIAENQDDLMFISGIYFMSFLFNVMLLYVYRSRMYAYYLIYIVNIWLLSTIVWSTYYIPYMTIYGHNILGIVGTIAALLFTQEFLNLKRDFPLCKRILNFCLFASLPFLFTSFFEVHNTSKFGTGVIGMASLACISISAYIYFKTRQLHKLHLY